MASSIYISVRWNPLYEVSPPLPPLKPHPNLGSPLTRLTGRTLLLATFRTPRDLENSFLGVKPSCSRSWAEEIQKKRKRRNLGSSNILKIFKLNIPFHRVTISYLYQYRFNLRGSSFSNQLIASLVNSHSLHDESPNKGNRLCKFFCQLW